MAWQSYGLDQKAQQLVLDAKKRDRDSLNQSYKMRMATAYGLERFWGEHLRLQGRERTKSAFWKDTWDVLVEAMANADVTLPNDSIGDTDDTDAIQSMSDKLWQLQIDDQRVSLAVLTQLCDCIVWWTQRYK
ncbi:hypothetical protein [Vacuolonema iberomarrocanum]|uniref:hypothetical protein n=1 Tax=Vacuolonema iberomarrocanum TaxID=3454632 RepID=UPI0019FD12C2|nr:hypothetical protein [filamentous cyanobacterium LEGE 07170]